MKDRINIKDGKVYKNEKEIGYVRRFCCGVDFGYDNTSVLFSILGVKMGESKLLTSVKALLSIKLPPKTARFSHWNFSYEKAKDKLKLKEYEQKLSEIK